MTLRSSVDRRGDAPVTQANILDGLVELGVRPGMELEVHSSLSSFGHVEGGASAVITALMQAVGPQGSLYMPALRLSPELPLTDEDERLGITRKIRILSPDAKRSGMGMIADTFRCLPDVAVGEGIFRVCAWGRSAPCVQQGFEYLLKNDGMGLLLGVDIYRLTAMHAVEHLLPQRVRNIFAPTQEMCRIYSPDQWFIEAGAPPVNAWYTIQRLAIERRLIREGTIGPCRCMLFRLRDVVGLYEQALREQPLQLYGLGV